MSDDRSKMTILVNDRAGEGLEAEHGFSVLIETDGRRILFDTGPGAIVRSNAEKLGIDLETVDTVVLSHGHCDHSGGIPSVMRGRTDIDLYFHPGALTRRWSIDARGTREIGITSEALEVIREIPVERLHRVLGASRITQRVGIVAPIPRRTSFEDSGGPFFLDAEASAADPVEDDLAMWIESAGGILLLVGCCHAGIINTLAQVNALTGRPKVNTVVGGLHLLHAGRPRMRQTVESLPQLVDMSSESALILCHCTGESAIDELRAIFGSAIAVAGSGAVLQPLQRPGGGVFFSPSGRV